MSDTIGHWSSRDAPNGRETDGFASSLPVYEWKEEYATDAPKVDEGLEDELFCEESRINTGIHFDGFQKFKVMVKNGPSDHRPIHKFEDAGMHQTVMDNVNKMKYSKPTPVQMNAIPIVMKGYDMMTCAQTGSGKTAAFLLPIVSMLLSNIAKVPLTRSMPGERRSKAAPLALFITPTRELAIQTFNDARRFTNMSQLRPCVLYGGADVASQKEKLARGCDILIATPGRLRDVLQRNALTLVKIRHVVMDEADRLLDQGFGEQIRELLTTSDLNQDDNMQSLMFSATFPLSVQELATDFLKENYCKLRIGRIGGTTSAITQRLVLVEEADKCETLVRLLLSQPPSRTLIFVDSKRGADTLDDFLYNKKFPVTSIHSDRTQKEREDALFAFKSGHRPILIATAVASRGLDIKDVLHVINFDLCKDIDEYVHRIGRTARVGHPGLATSFYNDRNADIAPEIKRILIECNQDVPPFFEDIELQEEDWDNDTEPTANVAA